MPDLQLLSIADLKKQSHEDFQFLFRQKRFYKYASFQVAKEIIMPEQTLKFSPPEFFNDPFDCNEELLDIHMDETHIRGFAGEQLNKMPPVMQQFVMGRMLGGKAVHEALRNEKKNFKICCFSTRHDDTLMWSHYADKHTGICLGFEFPIRGDIFTLYPVRYIDEIRKLHGMADTATIFHYWLTRKPSCWAYENEIRAITRSGMELIKFEQQRLREVIFGCKVSQKQIDSVITHTKKLDYVDLVYKRLMIDNGSFSLKSIDL